MLYEAIGYIYNSYVIGAHAEEVLAIVSYLVKGFRLEINCGVKRTKTKKISL